MPLLASLRRHRHSQAHGLAQRRARPVAAEVDHDGPASTASLPPAPPSHSPGSTAGAHHCLPRLGSARAPPSTVSAASADDSGSPNSATGSAVTGTPPGSGRDSGSGVLAATRTNARLVATPTASTVTTATTAGATGAALRAPRKARTQSAFGAALAAATHPDRPRGRGRRARLRARAAAVDALDALEGAGSTVSKKKKGQQQCPTPDTDALYCSDVETETEPVDPPSFSRLSTRLSARRTAAASVAAAALMSAERDALRARVAGLEMAAVENEALRGRVAELEWALDVVRAQADAARDDALAALETASVAAGGTCAGCGAYAAEAEDEPYSVC